MNKYDKFLEFFVASANEYYREYLQQPRPLSGNIYASNGHIAARVKAELCEGEYSAHDRQPNFLLFLTDVECSLLMDIEEVARTIANAPEEEPQYYYPKCPECAGEKYVTWRYKAEDGAAYEREDECPVCDGCGVMPDKVKQETIKHISINGIFFEQELFKRVLDAIYNLGINRVTVDISRPNIATIQVCPDVVCWIMPSFSKGIKPSCSVTLNEEKP